ncbi:class I adenylate-forming enzyme family protein [Rhodococcus sp. NPDC003322]
MTGRRDRPRCRHGRTAGVTVPALLRSHSAAHPDRPMVIDTRDRLSYRELDAATHTVAATLVQHGIGKGTRVGVLMPNSTRWLTIVLALARIGAVAVPLSTLLTPRELRAQLATASVRFLVAVEEFRGRRHLDGLAAELGSALPTGKEPLLNPALPALRGVWTPEYLALHRPAPEALALVDPLSDRVTAADDLVVIFTSGSSGSPKGVIHSHGSALAAVIATLADRCIGPDTRLYLPMPFFWVGGFGAGILSALAAGATLVTEEVPSPESTLKLLERERVTLFRGWPDQAQALAAEGARADLSSLRPGSLEALLPAELRSAPGARANLFGMTESFGPYSGHAADTDMPRTAWGSCGRPFDGVELRIVDTRTGETAPVGTVGEIRLRGTHLLRGICRRRREDVFTPDGFYRTGDLGRVDEDGFLFYQGRSDDMFKVSGATVYPSEVQAALRTLPGVRAAFVTSLPGPAGDRVAVAVVGGPELTSETLRRGARALLSAFKVPSVWRIVHDDADIPRGATGKVDPSRLRELLADTGDNPRPHTGSPLAAPVPAGTATKVEVNP